MSAFSILYEAPDDGVREHDPTEPVFFSDLHLDQVVDAAITGFQEYDIRPFFYDPLTSVDAVMYRQEVVRDLGDTGVFEAVSSFSQGMQSMRQQLSQAQKLHYRYEKERWFLDAVTTYCETVQRLVRNLADLDLRSRGFLNLFDYLDHFAQSPDFTSLVAEVNRLRTELSGVTYGLHFRGNQITVLKSEFDDEYVREVERTFERFLQEPFRTVLEESSQYPGMNHVEAKVLDLVATLYPDVFAHLDAFQKRYADYLDATIARFDREIQFYVAYLELVATIQGNGLPFCLPRVSDVSKEVCCQEEFDLALAIALTRDNRPIVTNDFFLRGQERILVVTGPNQGGKTTFARTFGQVHYLASLGLPVPGREARLFLFDELFTHFEREETIENLRSKLEDDLERIHAIFTRSTPRSIIIINEMFTSTTVQDALFLGRRVLEQAIRLDMLCVYVTFLDELSTLEKTVSMVGTVDPDDPDVRTFRIVRRPADGLSYATAIARKNRVRYEDILERIPP